MRLAHPQRLHRRARAVFFVEDVKDLDMFLRTAAHELGVKKSSHHENVGWITTAFAMAPRPQRFYGARAGSSTGVGGRSHTNSKWTGMRFFQAVREAIYSLRAMIRDFLAVPLA